MKNLILILIAFTMTACAGTAKESQVSRSQTDGIKVESLRTGGYKKTQTYANRDQYITQRQQSSDAALAAANSDCWKSYFESKKASALQMPSTNDPVALMAFAMVQSNQAMVTALAGKSNDFQPCQMATNSNDLGIAKENGKTARRVSANQAWGNAGPKVLLGVVGGVLGYKGITSNRDIQLANTAALSASAVAGINRAGNNISVNGDGNTTDTVINDVEQTADNGSTISGSGNYTEGLPVNPSDLVLTASNEPTDPEACTDANGDGFVDGQTGVLTVEECEGGEPVAMELITNAEQCTLAGGDAYRAINDGEDASVVDPDGDGFVCSDGNGGVLTMFTPEA